MLKCGIKAKRVSKISSQAKYRYLKMPLKYSDKVFVLGYFAPSGSAWTWLKTNTELSTSNTDWSSGSGCWCVRQESIETKRSWYSWALYNRRWGQRCAGCTSDLRGDVALTSCQCRPLSFIHVALHYCLHKQVNCSGTSRWGTVTPAFNHKRWYTPW